MTILTKDTIIKAIPLLYSYVKENQRLKSFFEDVNMVDQIHKFSALFRILLGNKKEYCRKFLLKKHKPYNIGE